MNENHSSSVLEFSSGKSGSDEMTRLWTAFDALREKGLSFVSFLGSFIDEIKQENNTENLSSMIEDKVILSSLPNSLFFQIFLWKSLRLCGKQDDAVNWSGMLKSGHDLQKYVLAYCAYDDSFNK